jgi:hypothetical protein
MTFRVRQFRSFTDTCKLGRPVHHMTGNRIKLKNCLDWILEDVLQRNHAGEALTLNAMWIGTFAVRLPWTFLAY